MTDPIPNLAALEMRQALRMARQEEAQQIAAKARFTEEVEQGFNPEAAAKQQARLGRFRSLESRKRSAESEQRKIAQVAEKTEDDLANSYHRRNPELPPDRLRRLRENLRQGQSAEEVLRDVTEAFRDPALNDPTLIDETLEYLEKTSTGALQANITRARELLNELKGREVIAGRNVDSAAKSYHKKGIGSSATELRNLYREITGNPRDHNTLFSELSNQYPFDQLKLVVAFLLKGMAFDLKSKGPSIQQAELMRLMTETRNLQSILWVYLFFKGRMDLIKTLYAQYGLTLSDALTFERLAREFIRLVEERYPSVMKLLKQTENLELLNDLEKIIILMQYRDAIRGLSPRIYKSLRHRQDLLLVILESLEELEDREEAKEEGEGIVEKGKEKKKKRGRA